MRFKDLRALPRMRKHWQDTNADAAMTEHDREHSFSPDGAGSDESKREWWSQFIDE